MKKIACCLVYRTKRFFGKLCSPKFVPANILHESPFANIIRSKTATLLLRRVPLSSCNKYLCNGANMSFSFVSKFAFYGTIMFRKIS